VIFVVWGGAIAEGSKATQAATGSALLHCQRRQFSALEGVVGDDSPPLLRIEKEVLSLMIGPPNVKPKSFQRNGAIDREILLKKPLALMSSLRKNSYALPWKRFVPLRVMTVISPLNCVRAPAGSSAAVH